MSDLRARLAEVLANHANDADFMDYGGTVGPMADLLASPALARALEDAERYRWLRDESHKVEGMAPAVILAESDFPVDGEGTDGFVFGPHLDAAIDAARKKPCTE